MSHAFKEYLRDFLKVYMDDLCIHSGTRDQHAKHLKLIFQKCKVYKICLNLEKCVFMVRQGKTLGHIVLNNGISTHFEKIEVIVSLPRPRNAKQVHGFMGHCGYYWRFIFQYASMLSLSMH